MSYHLNMEKNKKTEIEMPPLPQESTSVDQPQSQENTYEMHPELRNTVPFEAQEQPQQTQENTTPEEPVVQHVEAPKVDQAKNFRMLKEQRDRAERERDEAIRKYRELQTSNTQENLDYRQNDLQSEYRQKKDLNVDPNDFVEGKHLNELHKEHRQLKEELRAYQQETRLRNEFPDFDKVVSKDNIDQLKMEYPELAETISSSPNLYSKAVSAYTLIKKLGISTMQDIYQQDKERAIRNATKPKPLASVSPQQGDSPLSKANAFANGLTDELKEQLRKEMYAAIKNK